MYVKHSWVIDLDIQEFFEDVDHELLYKALRVHVSEKTGYLCTSKDG